MNPIEFEANEFGSADRFVQLAQGKVVFCPELESWIAYDQEDGIWRQTDERLIAYMAITILAKDMDAEIASLKRKIAQFDDADPSDGETLLRQMRNRLRALQTHEAQVKQSRGAHAIVRLASGNPAIRVSLNAFDANPLLVNIKNGTLNLQTLTLESHAPNDYLMRRFNAAYEPEASCPRFMAFLKTITIGDHEMQRYLQLLAGQALRGTITAEALYVCIGEGDNGKSTLFFDIMGNLFTLGAEGYAFVYDPAMLTELEGGAEKPTATRLTLRGCRWAIFREPSKGAALNDATVKSMAQREAISARAPHAPRPVIFAPSHTAILLTNSIPTVKDCTTSMRRRIKILPFTYKFEESVKDEEFGRNLVEEEGNGIFAWIVEGYRLWVENGCKMPALPYVAQLATDEMWESTDRLAAWINSHTVKDGTSWLGTTEMYHDYCSWLGERGVISMPTET
jgi:putative DNA primase/helicase